MFLTDNKLYTIYLVHVVKQPTTPKRVLVNYIPIGIHREYQMVHPFLWLESTAPTYLS